MSKQTYSLSSIIASDSKRLLIETKSGMRRELKQRIKTCKALVDIFNNVNVTVELNKNGTVNNGSFYESILKALLTFNCMNYYTTSNRGLADVSSELYNSYKDYFNAFDLNKECDYEIKTSMCNEANDLTEGTEHLIVVNYYGCYLLGKSDIEQLTSDNFKKGTKRLKNNVTLGKPLMILNSLLGF